MSLMLRTLVVVATLALAGQAQAYGLFSCVDSAGREVCVIDTGAAANIVPSQLCNASCPPCAGRCDAARYYESQSGRWQQSWQGTPGITGNNILVPGASPQGDAQTILQEGLVAPGYPQALPQGYPQEMPQDYSQTPPQGYPQALPQGYPQAPPQGYPQAPPAYPQELPPAGYPGSGYTGS